MKTQVEFRSSKFPPYEGEEEQINPGFWGKRLAEDWGWYVPVRNEGFRLALCCGHQNGDDDEFVCFTDLGTPIVKKFFERIDATAQFTHLTEALQQTLVSDPEIRDVVWTESR